MTLLCSINDCGRLHYGKGWCENHYKRWLRHGDPLGGRTNGAAAIWLEVHKNFDGVECLTWPFSKDKDGYALIWKDGTHHRVCRLVCERRYGPPPTSKHETAHSCGKGHLGCVNGLHLRWATKAENETDKILHGTRWRKRNPQGAEQ